MIKHRSDDPGTLSSWSVPAGWACLLLAWLSLFSRASLWWSEASYYTHGWCVPFLAILLLSRSRKGPVQEEGSPGSSWLLPLALAALLVFPSRMLGEPDPFWRIPLWLEMISLSALSYSFARAANLGFSRRAWTLATLYLLTCLPWPAVLESSVVHSLTFIVAAFAAEALLWFGHPAEVMGNAILVDRETISIDQACSGIRSLQNLLSFALFFALYYRLDGIRALLGITIGVLLSLGFNSLRALALSLVFLEFGPEDGETWHDAIGNSFIICSFISLWLIARLLSDKEATSGNKDRKKEVKRSGNRTIPWTYSAAFVLPEALVIAWFACLPGQTGDFTWEVALGPDASVIPEGVREVLLFDYGKQGEIPIGPGAPARVIHFGYLEDSAAASLCSRNHDPETCMQYSGVRLVDSESLHRFRFGSDELLFRHYSTPPGKPGGPPSLHVFWCSAVLDSRIRSFEFEDPSALAKSLRFLSGKLSYRRKVLLVSLSGERTSVQAKQDLDRVLGSILRPIREKGNLSLKDSLPLEQGPLFREHPFPG